MIRRQVGIGTWSMAAIIVGCAIGLSSAQGLQLEPLSGLTWKPTKKERVFTFEYKPEESKPAIEGYLTLPNGIGPFRTVILVHSPSGNAVQAAYHYAPKFADRGYASLSVELSFAKKVEESDWEEMFRRLSACLEIVQHDERLDPKKIFIYGNGPGAMVSLAYAAQSEKFQAVALTGSGLIPKDGVKYEKISAPVILVHGANDESVALDAAMQLKSNLERAGKTVEIKVFEKSGHEVITLKADDVFDAIVAFFNKNAK
jgi:dienelactone hydrolase